MWPAVACLSHEATAVPDCPAQSAAIGAVPALIALTLYALLPIMRNTVAGLAEVGEGIRQPGTALGVNRAQRLRLVELPLA